MEKTRGFWKHVDNGLIYAVESTMDGQILGGIGPVRPTSLSDLDSYTYEPKIKPWLKMAMERHKLQRVGPAVYYRGGTGQKQYSN
ncbi:MAG: hypothetical protein JW828_05040 [Sedimentisphaerales bacterium]|nr:hypothetical protein [Sedimentisphaerales bacterium]